MREGLSVETRPGLMQYAPAHLAGRRPIQPVYERRECGKDGQRGKDLSIPALAGKKRVSTYAAGQV